MVEALELRSDLPVIIQNSIRAGMVQRMSTTQ